MGIPGSDELGGRGDHKRVRPFNPAHGIIHSLLDRWGMEPLLHDDIGNYLAVGGSVEDRAVLLQTGSQLIGVGQISVVCQRHPPLVVVDDDGLGIALAVGAGGGIADVPHDDVSAPQPLEALLRKTIPSSR